MTLKLTIGIPTYGREQVLIDTLRQVLRYRDRTLAEVIVVDQTPEHDEATARQLQTWADAAELRWEHAEAPSLTAARNRVVEMAKGEVILFLDDDVLIPPELFARHLAAYAHDGIHAVTGQVYNCLSHHDPPALDAPEQGTLPHSEFNEAMEANNISGGNHSVRTCVIKSVGGYDTGFVASALGEDLDISQRLKRAGYTIWYDPSAWIIHLAVPRGGCGISQNDMAWPEWTHASGLCLYAFRHGIRQGNFGRILWMSLRNGPLRKDVVSRPWRWPAAWWGWCRACAYGFRHREKVRGITGETTNGH